MCAIMTLGVVRRTRETGEYINGSPLWSFWSLGSLWVPPRVAPGGGGSGYPEKGDVADTYASLGCVMKERKMYADA